MTRMIFASLLAAALCGCSSLKDQTGEYVSEAIANHIAEKIDEKLERRGLSIAQIKEITDINGDGTIDINEVRTTARSVATDLIESYSAKLSLEQRSKWDEATKNLVTRDEQAGVKGDLKDFWAWISATLGLLVTTVIGYLVKQVFSAKSDGRRDTDIAKNQARMDALEKLLNRDLNNDGRIGGAGASVAAGGPRVEA